MAVHIMCRINGVAVIPVVSLLLLHNDVLSISMNCLSFCKCMIISGKCHYDDIRTVISGHILIVCKTYSSKHVEGLVSNLSQEEQNV
jgi:galactitol-specific phosphotransferase system IIC component